MPKYQVWLEAFKTIDIEADNEAEAVEQAKITADEEPTEWQIGDIEELVTK